MREHAVDESDQATEQEMMATEIAIAKARKGVTIPPMGKCYNCEETLPEPLRWCDIDCMLDYSHRKTAENINGIIR